MNRYLRLSSILLLFAASCATPYKGFKEQKSDSSVFRFQPDFDRVLYRGIVDGKVIFKKFHLSGVLFFKELKNGTKRVVFQNEMGIAFFDFEWDKEGHFSVKQMMPQMKKDAVIRTLQKDMEMLLMIGLDKKSEIMLRGDRGNERLYRLNRGNGYVYYEIDDNKLVKIENANKRKKVVTVEVSGKDTPTSMPDTVLFRHHKANFTISLTKIRRNNVNE